MAIPDTYIYNPADPEEAEDAAFTFNGIRYTLKPNVEQSLTDLVDKDFDKKLTAGLLNACLTQLKDLGVIKLTGVHDVDPKLRIAAETKHSEWLRAKYSGVLIKHALASSAAEDAGLVPLAESPEVRLAKTRLKEWELLDTAPLVPADTSFAAADKSVDKAVNKEAEKAPTLPVIPPPAPLAPPVHAPNKGFVNPFKNPKGKK